MIKGGFRLAALAAFCLAGTGILFGQKPPEAASIVLPGTPDDKGAVRAVTILADCAVRVQNGADVESIHRCGSTGSLPDGPLRVWVEQGGRISPLIQTSRAELTGQTTTLPLGPAGSIRVTTPAMPHSSLRAYAVERGGTAAGTRPLFSRRAESSGPLLMPAGLVVVVAMDISGNAVAVSAPAEVRSGAKVEITLAVPSRNSDLVTFLTSPEPQQPLSIAASLRFDSATMPAAVVGAGTDRTLAVWYGVPSEDAQLQITSDKAALPPDTLRIHDPVVTYRAELQKPPALDVDVVASSADSLPPLALEVVRLDDGSPLRKIEIEPGLTPIEGLPPTIVEVRLHVGEWATIRRVSLEGTTHERIQFELVPIKITGLVSSGNNQVPATVEFGSNGTWVTTISDQRGRYALTLWQPGLYEIRATPLRDDGHPPYTDVTRVEESRTIDIDLPPALWDVKVTSAATGKPIDRATVAASNRWIDPARGRKGATQSVKTDDQGIARLQPLREGTVQIQARADGFDPSEMLSREVGPEDLAETIEIKLKPASDAAGLHVLLPDGRPAAGAQAVLLDALYNIVSVGTVDASGNLAIPRSPLVLVIRSEGVATRVLVLEDSVTQIQLRPEAPPLAVRASRPTGTSGRWALIVAWIDGIRLSGRGLAFAVSSGEQFDSTGTWIARGLPAGPLKILAGTHRIATELRSGAFDNQAKLITFPWPASPAIVTVD
ncbi:MAG: carboxypeptidase-like regulatory domain-containing protein [Acidobacteriota bacterium]